MPPPGGAPVDEAYRNDTCLPPSRLYMLPLLVVAASLLPVTRTPLPNKPPTSEHAHNKQLGLLDSLSTVLDKHALDPLDPSPSRVPGLDYFKRLAREDYASAEVIWADSTARFSSRLQCNSCSHKCCRRACCSTKLCARCA